MEMWEGSNKFEVNPLEPAPVKSYTAEWIYVCRWARLSQSSFYTITPGIPNDERQWAGMGLPTSDIENA